MPQWSRAIVRVEDEDLLEILNGPAERLEQRFGLVGVRFFEVRIGLVTLEEAAARFGVDLPAPAGGERMVMALWDAVTMLVRTGHRKRGYELSVLMKAATEQMANRVAVWPIAAAAYLQAVTQLLRGFPDIPMFETALAVADRFVTTMRLSPLGPDEAGLALAYSCRGQLRVMVVSPEASHGEVEYWDQDGPWTLLAAKNAGPGERQRIEQHRLSDPVAQMQAAADDLANAVRLRTGERRGGSLVMLAQAEAWLAKSGLADLGDVVAHCREALAVLDARGDKAPMVQTAKALLASCGAPTPAASDISLEPLSDWATRFGWRSAIDMALSDLTMRLSANGAVDARAALLRYVADLPWEDIAADQRGALLGRAAHLLDGGAVPCQGNLGHSAVSDGLRTATADDTSRPEEWDDDDLGVAVCTHLAMHAADNGDAMALLDQVHDRARAASHLLCETHAFTRGYRWLSEAANLTGHRETQRAADAAGRAIRQGLELDLPGLINGGLGRLANLPSQDPSTETAEAILEALLGFTAAVDRFSDDEGRRLLHAVALTTAPLCPGSDDGAVMRILLHRRLFRAPVFGVLAGHPMAVALDPTADGLLQEATRLDSRQVVVEEPAGVAILDELGMLAYAGGTEQLPGRFPSEVLANARQRFDSYLNELATAQGDRPEGFLPFGFDDGTDALAAAVADGTVLLDLWMGVDGERHVAAYSTVISPPSREDPELGVSLGACCWEMSMDSVVVSDRAAPTATLLAAPAAPLLAELRMALQDQPEARPVSRAAQQQLEEWGFRLLAGNIEELRGLRQATDHRHLCVMASGPLAFSPVHLMMAESGRSLADDWIVTMLPSLSLLARVDPPPGKGLIAACSSSGGRPFGYPDVPEVVAQARAVAAAGGGRLMSDGAVQDVLREATSARYLHLAAHGSDYPFAPSFQCLYLTPGTTDGRLFAHDVIRYDLRGVELVTLSACESGLGRVDSSDNPRGLIAAFLQAGTRAVVAALWPVGPGVSAVFFEHLYARLAADADVLQAFRAGQLAARESYPGYRDWGAFTLTGAWSRRELPQ